MEFHHTPIMLAQCVDLLDIDPSGTYVDCTAGGGGHSEAILSHLTTGTLVCIDKDIEAINACKQRLEPSSKNIVYIHQDYKHFSDILHELNITQVNGILIDLGISSYQIDNKERGFSYMARDVQLDMRMDRSQALSAKTVVNTYSEKQLFEIIRDYGEEKFAHSIARNIVAARESGEIVTCGQLVDIIDISIPYAFKRNTHPAKKTFQALRIEVNSELTDLKAALLDMVDALAPAGRMVVLTFHSLEDRIVKLTFADLATDCICPPSIPICVCDHRAKVKLLNKKPLVASPEEQTDNPRSISCKLRAITKI
jgi:16S rRNA (cytosine1402-N4)-methyltransferase